MQHERWLARERRSMQTLSLSEIFLETMMVKNFSVQHIDHVVFRVRDWTKSVEFYRNMLSGEVVHEREHRALVHLQAVASTIDLVSVDGKREHAVAARRPAARCIHGSA